MAEPLLHMSLLAAAPTSSSLHVLACLALCSERVCYVGWQASLCPMTSRPLGSSWLLPRRMLRFLATLAGSSSALSEAFPPLTSILEVKA